MRRVLRLRDWTRALFTRNNGGCPGSGLNFNHIIIVKMTSVLIETMLSYLSIILETIPI